MMTARRLEALKALAKPKLVKLSAGVLAVIGGWDVLSSQFGVPTLGHLLGLGSRTIPIWAWFDLVLLLLFYGLFELVRQTLDREQTSVPVENDPPEATVEPDLPFDDVVRRVAAAIGGGPPEKLGREIADKVKLRGLRVWARYYDQAIEEMTGVLGSATFDVRTRKLLLPGMMDSVEYHDLRFIEAEVDQVWPAVDTAEKSR